MPRPDSRDLRASDPAQVWLTGVTLAVCMVLSVPAQRIRIATCIFSWPHYAPSPILRSSPNTPMNSYGRKKNTTLLSSEKVLLGTWNQDSQFFFALTVGNPNKLLWRIESSWKLMLNSLLPERGQNAVRATIESHPEASESALPAVHVTIANNDQDFILRSALEILHDLPR